GMCGTELTGSDRTVRLPLNLQGLESWPFGLWECQSGLSVQPKAELNQRAGMTWGRFLLASLNLSHLPCGSQGKSALKWRQCLRDFEKRPAGTLKKRANSRTCSR